MAPVFVLVCLSSLISWPLMSGTVPASGDHPVHLARADAQLDALMSGQLRTWWDGWGFGTPVGDLYPPLADLLVAAIRLLSLGTLSISSCYALAVLIGFSAPAWVLPRVAKLLGLPTIAGVIAGALLLLDPGAGREGGWIYTLWMGVWPQALATAMQWMAFAWLVRLAHADDVNPTRAAGKIGVYAGLAVLAHPISAPVLALWIPVVAILALAKRRLAATALFGAGGLALGALLAAWWWLPMLSMRGWMASYGWLHTTWAQMSDAVINRLALTQNMPPSIGLLALVGILWFTLKGTSTQRALVAATSIVWLAAGRDWVWLFRPDRLSEVFTHLQYQRFLIAAKPGLFLVVGGLLSLLVAAPQRDPQFWSPRRYAAVGARLALALVAVIWSGKDVLESAKRFSVGHVPVEAIRTAGSFEDDKTSLYGWLDQQANALGRPVRVVFDDGRNVHWLMDATARATVQVYKVGFTPGDNFVHKPESRDPEVLEWFQPDFVITRGKKRDRVGEVAASFGSIDVRAKKHEDRHLARIIGPGSISIRLGAIEDEGIEFDISDSIPTSRLTLAVAGYARWEITRDGEPVEWEETPLHGDGAPVSREARAQGSLRGGKAAGDDGREPTLISVPNIQDGSYHLSYHRWRWRDVFGLLLTMLGVVLAVRTLQGRGPFRLFSSLAKRQGARRSLAILTILGLLFVSVRWRSARTGEDGRASFQLRGATNEQLDGLRPGLFKTEMTIGPAIIIPSNLTAPRELVWTLEHAPKTLEGWVAVQDDWTKRGVRGGYKLRILARAEGVETEMWRGRTPRTEGKRSFTMDMERFEGHPVELLVRLEHWGKTPPKAGFDLLIPKNSP